MRREYWLVPLLAILVMALNIAVSIVVVWVYSSFVAPGQDLAAYEAFAMQSAPLSSVIAGIPILFGAAWIAARNSGSDLRAGIAVGILYIVIDAALIFAAGGVGDLLGWVALSYVTKLAAAALGAYLGSRRA